MARSHHACGWLENISVSPFPAETASLATHFLCLTTWICCITFVAAESLVANGENVASLSLPEVVLVRFIADWLSIADIVKSDSAHCSRANRIHFHRILRSPGMVVNSPHDVIKGLYWFTALELKFSTLSLEDSNIDMALLTAHIATLGGDHIQNIRCSKITPHGPVLMPMLSVTCRKLKRVTFQHCGGLIYYCDSPAPPWSLFGSRTANWTAARHWTKCICLNYDAWECARISPPRC